MDNRRYLEKEKKKKKIRGMGNMRERKRDRWTVREKEGKERTQ